MTRIVACPVPYFEPISPLPLIWTYWLASCKKAGPPRYVSFRVAELWKNRHSIPSVRHTPCDIKAAMITDYSAI
jgi:hypothetical protein